MLSTLSSRLRVFLVSFLVLSLLLSSVFSVSAESSGSAIYARLGENVTFVNVCLADGLFDNTSYADLAISSYPFNGVVFPIVNMSVIGSGMFAHSLVFNETGNYIAVETCYYVNGSAYSQGTENVVVSYGFDFYVFLILAVLSLIVGFNKNFRIAHAFSAVFLFVWAVGFSENIYISVLIFLISGFLLFEGFRK